MPAKGSIYTLTDPRDGSIRYVGKTTKPLPERLAGHLASPTNPAMALWIATLRAHQTVPTITLIASVSEQRLGAEEERLITKHARAGHRLFNAPYYPKHFEDLISASPPPTARGRILWRLVCLALMGAYLWSVGFDLLLRREVLPRLTTAEGARFWHEYLARPVSLIAVHVAMVLVSCLLIAWFRRRRAARRSDPARIAAAAARALDWALSSRSA